MKSLVGKLGMLALLASVAGACSSTGATGPGRGTGSSEPVGDVGLKLVPVTGVVLDTVHYVVTTAATPPAVVSEGDLPTPGTDKDFSFGLSLPVGTGYTISLSAASAALNDNITCGGSFGPFEVKANISTNFSLTLSCHDDTNGSASGGVVVKTDACPRLVFDYVVAVPGAADVGKNIAVAAKAHDLDNKVVSYAWKVQAPAVGGFTPATGANSSLKCDKAGVGQLLTVTASNGECSKELTTTVSCKSVLCGNGLIDPGETCDTALAAPCPSDCNSECGDGVVEPPVETCEPKDTRTCGLTCVARVPACGDGYLQPAAGEVCDKTEFPAGTPAGSTCTADCKTINSPAVAVCGNGLVDGTEVCDVAKTDATYGQLCSTDCKFKIASAACVACELDSDCSGSVTSCLGSATVAFDAVAQKQCFDVMECINRTSCLDGAGSVGKCYCGTLSTAACGAAPFDLTAAGAPNGPCAAVMQAGYPGLTTNSAILGATTAGNRPSGAAGKRLNCDKTANEGKCVSACGLDSTATYP